MAKERWLTATEVLNIPSEHLPLMVLSDNPKSFISWAIKARTGGVYNHFMWMHKPGVFLSQNYFLEEVGFSDYEKHGLKFVWNPKWDKVDRIMLLSQIKADLQKPKWQTRYDWLQIFGKLLPWAEWFNWPRTKICSDYASYLKAVDDRYDLYHPAPAEVNRWLMANGYKTYGRYRHD